MFTTVRYKPVPYTKAFHHLRPFYFFVFRLNITFPSAARRHKSSLPCSFIHYKYYASLLFPHVRTTPMLLHFATLYYAFRPACCDCLILKPRYSLHEPLLEHNMNTNPCRNVRHDRMSVHCVGLYTGEHGWRTFWFQSGMKFTAWTALRTATNKCLVYFLEVMWVLIVLSVSDVFSVFSGSDVL